MKLDMAHDKLSLQNQLDGRDICIARSPAKLTCLPTSMIGMRLLPSRQYVRVVFRPGKDAP